MPKHVTMKITLNVGDETPPTYEDHYAALGDKDIAALLNVLNDAATAAARQVDAELRFEVRWSSMTWSLDRPSDHPPVEDEATEEEDVA